MLYSKKILGSLIVGTTLAAASPVIANESKEYDFAAFEKVSVSAGIDAEIIIGDAQSVRAEAGTKSALNKLKIEVRDGKLFVTRETSGFLTLFPFSKKAVKLTIETPRLTGVDANSGADVFVSGNYGTSLSASASSGADLTLNKISANDVTLSVSSGANINADGDCDTLMADASSGADINADNLECLTVSASSSSGADIDVFASSAITAKASSGGSVDVSGNPTTRDVSQSSGGDVDID